MMAGIVSQDMAATIWALETERSSTRRPTGTIMAPPRPCRMRAATRMGSEGARPQNTEAMVKMKMAARKTVLAPKWSAAQPLAGMKTERLMR